MKKILGFFLIIGLLAATSCKKNTLSNEDDIVIDSTVSKILVPHLESVYHALSQNPLEWTDDQLSFINSISESRIVGLGDASYGTKEFFQAKHRIFKYLVENHDFKVLAIEADVGESVYLNNAILNSNTDQIEQIMKEKMHYWSWNTQEVLDMLMWMSEYNKDKEEEEKLQYYGIDAQFNTYNPVLVGEYLQLYDTVLYQAVNPILVLVVEASTTKFEGYENAHYQGLLNGLEAIKDSLEFYESTLSALSSQKEYGLIYHLLEVSIQSLHWGYSVYTNDEVVNGGFRDEAMAINAKWVADYFEGDKITLWSHNTHIQDNNKYNLYGSMGYHLRNFYPENYSALGFTFSQGNFNAINTSTNTLEEHLINATPITKTLNEILAKANSKVYAVSLADLVLQERWKNLLSDGLFYFMIGSGYNGVPESFYYFLIKDYYNQLIYFDETNASELLSFEKASGKQLFIPDIR